MCVVEALLTRSRDDVRCRGSADSESRRDAGGEDPTFHVLRRPYPCLLRRWPCPCLLRRRRSVPCPCLSAGRIVDYAGRRVTSPPCAAAMRLSPLCCPPNQGRAEPSGDAPVVTAPPFMAMRCRDCKRCACRRWPSFERSSREALPCDTPVASTTHTPAASPQSARLTGLSSESLPAISHSPPSESLAGAGFTDRPLRHVLTPPPPTHTHTQS